MKKFGAAAILACIGMMEDSRSRANAVSIEVNEMNGYLDHAELAQISVA
jgi:hypothetical protein